jgi:NitT/TauT family transport system substrate-binding protein
VNVILKLGGGKQFHVLMSSRDARGMITDVLAFRQSTIQQQPKLVEGIVRATLEGLAFMQREPAKAAAIIAKKLEITPAEVMAQLPNIENPPLAQCSDIFKHENVLPSFYATGRIIGDILIKQGLIPALPPIESTFDGRFIAALQANPGELK